MIADLVGRQRWLPRWVHRAYANWLGYFWTSCEDCGKWWGGHEWIDSDRQTRQTELFGGTAAYCPECGRSGRHPLYLPGIR